MKHSNCSPSFIQVLVTVAVAVLSRCRQKLILKGDDTSLWSWSVGEGLGKLDTGGFDLIWVKGSLPLCFLRNKVSGYTEK